MPSQLINRGDVMRAAREAHHVPAAAGGAESFLQRGHDAQRIEDVASGLGAATAGADLSEGELVECAVLPDLELSEMKAEGLCLPQQMLNLAKGQARRAGRGQRIAGRAQVGPQLRRRVIRKLAIARASRTDPIRQVQHEDAVRLVGRTRGEGVKPFWI